MPLPLIVVAAGATVAGTLVGSIANQLIREPISNLLQSTIPHENVRVQLVMKAYALGAISRGDFLIAEEITQLAPPTKKIIIALADYLAQLKTISEVSTESLHLVRELEKTADELDKLTFNEFDAQVDSIETELKALEREEVELEKEELKIFEQEELRYREVVLRQLETKLAKAAVGENAPVPRVDLISYVDFSKVARNALLRVLEKRLADGEPLSVELVLLDITELIKSEGLLIPESFDFAEERGYVERYRKEVNRTIHELTADEKPPERRVELISYTDFTKVAKNALLQVIGARFARNDTLTTEAVFIDLIATIKDKRLLLTEAFDFAEERGYFDRYKNEVNRIIFEVFPQAKKGDKNG